MRVHKGKIPQRLLHAAIILCAVVLCLTSIELALAKYISEGNANDSASVARFSPSLISDDDINISDIKKPGNSTEKAFTVQNFSSDSVSEVAMKYKIVLETTGNLPLRFTVLDSDESVIAVWICDGISGDQKYEYECPLVFSPGTVQAHNYKLKAEWPDAQNEAKFSGTTDAVSLSVVWEQVD